MSSTTQSATQAHGEFGFNMWWTCPEFVMADGAKARETAEKHGFDVQEDLPPVSRREEVSRAAYSFQDRRHKEGRRVTEKAKVTDQYVTYGILDMIQETSDEVSYKQGTTIKLEKESGRVEVAGVHAAEFEKALNLYTGAVTDEDVRNFFRRVVRMCRGVAKRPTGGIYFIPERYRGVIESAKAFVGELQVGAKLYVERVVNGAEERAIVWESVQNDIDSQIQDTLDAVGRIEKRASALADHSERLKELDEMARIYRDILGQEAKYEEVADKLKAAESKVASKLFELQKAGSVAAPVKAPAKRRVPGGVGKAAMQVAVEVLQQAGGPLHYRELVARMKAAGFEFTAADEASWLNFELGVEMKRGGQIARVGRGMYGLV